MPKYDSILSECFPRFGRLIVIGPSAYRTNNHGRQRMSLCLCDCGSLTVANNSNIKNSHTKSCGCSNGISSADKSLPEYSVWQGIIKRSLNPNTACFDDYMGRGISVCDEWVNSFHSFYDHVGARPGSEFSIDRIDNNGNYEPGNVRWADRTTQNRNKRNNFMITYNGETKCLMEWAEITGIHRATLWNRLTRSKMDASLAFTKTVADISNRGKFNYIIYNSEKFKLSDLARKHNISPKNLRQRLLRGWTVEQAVTTKLCHRRSK